MLKTASSKINLVAAVLALAAIVLTVVSSALTEANVLLGLSTAIAAGIGAIVLCVLPAVLNNDLVALIAPLGAIACNMVVLNITVSERILMIAGIFSYNSGDTAGWNVFYVVVASCVCVVLSCVANMVSSFMKK